MLAVSHRLPIATILPTAVIGLLRARRGQPGVWPVLDEADSLEGEPSLARVGLLFDARAEAAWLAGVLVALDPGLVVYAAKLHSLSLDQLAMIGVVATAVATSRHPSWRHAARLGVVVGLAALAVMLPPGGV